MFSMPTNSCVNASQLLNELAIENSPYAIIDVLKVVTEESKTKGVGIFCTAGERASR